MPSLDALVEAYRNTPSDHWGAPGDIKSIGTPRQYQDKVDALVQLLDVSRTSRPPRILDIGCFHGDFLSSFPDDWEKHGIELSMGAAEVARRRGITVHEGDVFSVELPDDYFDMIISCDVIEHLANQRAFAGLFRRWLRPQGIAVIETGGADSLLARLMGPRWYYLSIVEHVCAHSADSLDRLMGAEELRPVLRERRWHSLPPSWHQPVYRTARALTFRLGTAGLERVSKFIPLPRVARRLVERHSPWHATRDHLFHAYRLEA